MGGAQRALVVTSICRPGLTWFMCLTAAEHLHSPTSFGGQVQTVPALSSSIESVRPAEFVPWHRVSFRCAAGHSTPG